ncbi:MAG TPA: NAD(P)H-dependent oxidoreductase [Methylibium sp.]|nr:NAD(P)H-dependent oxidoreductase [Methylibium sp.]
MTRVLIIQGHPDPDPAHFGHALASAYADGARAAGHAVETVTVATLDFPLLRTRSDWEQGPVPPALAPVQQAIVRAEHLVFFFPLWMGGMPALLKGFIEQVARPGFAVGTGHPMTAAKPLTGRSARVVVTMGMPAAVYRWVFRAHGLKALERNILGLIGIAPVHETLVGSVEGSDAARQRWLAKLARLGRDGA